MPLEEDEYEIVPVGPIRRIEKRVEKMERSGSGNEMVKELIDVVRTNQKIIDEVVKINSEMINKVSELSAHVTQMTEKLNDFLERIEIGEATETVVEEKSGPEVEQRMQKLEKRINSMLLSTMKAKQFKPVVRKPLTM
ncbi:MAG TPA: hypothetical protein VJB05_04245 [archaeon]|nr:hypothetical protein [archaeon]